MQPPARPTTPVRWGEPPPGALTRLLRRVAAAFGTSPAATRAASLSELPVALRRTAAAVPYLEAESARDHPRAGAAATEAMQQAATAGEWWPADIWGHRALWHFERAGMELAATRAARLIGDLRSAAGDPASARRYYAEAISEARDIGAEREEGLAALGMGRGALQLGDVTTARRLAQVAIELFERCGAPSEELAAARELRGNEKDVSA